MSYKTQKLEAMAQEMIKECWDYHPSRIESPHADEILMLCAYPDGIFICDVLSADCNINNFKRLEMITSETWW